MARAAVLGTGLIGASIGIGLRGLGWTVVGWDPDEGALMTALTMGALDEAAGEAEVSADADLIVLAGPPAAIEEQLAKLDTAALVTDVAGVKAPMVAAGSHLKRYV